jgi:hypothetical protein
MGSGLEILLHVFLTSALDGDKLSVLRSGRITPREIALYPWDRRFVGLNNGFGPGRQLDEGEERKLAFS